MARIGPIIQSIEGIIEDDSCEYISGNQEIRRVEPVHRSTPAPPYADAFTPYRQDRAVESQERKGAYINLYA